MNKLFENDNYIVYKINKGINDSGNLYKIYSKSQDDFGTYFRYLIKTLIIDDRYEDFDLNQFLYQLFEANVLNSCSSELPWTYYLASKITKSKKSNKKTKALK